MIQIDLVPLLIAIVGSGGVGAAGAKLIDGLLKIRAGMSAREATRSHDIVQQRDEALSREARAWRLLDEADTKRRAVQEEAARLRRVCIVNGIEPGPELEFERTLTKSQLKALREKEE